MKILFKVLMSLFVFVSFGVAIAEEKAPISAPVKLENERIFDINSRIGSIDAKSRALTISARIKLIAEDKKFNPDDIYVEKNNGFDDIKIGDKIILSVTDQDAKVVKQNRTNVSKEYKTQIQKAIKNYRATHKKEFWLKRLLQTIFATAFAVMFLFLFRTLYAKLKDFLESKTIPDLKIQKTRLFSRNQVIFFATFCTKMILALLSIFVLYFYFVLIFSFFPLTSQLSDVLFNVFTETFTRFIVSVGNYLPNFLFIVLCVLTAHYVNVFIKFIFLEIARERITIKGFYPEWSGITSKIIRIIVYLITFAIILPYFPGANTDAFKVISIFFGVLISLGSSSSLSNMITGIILTYTRAFKVGDRLKIGETIGDVLENTLLVTRIRTIKNEVISIPNSIVISSHIVNYSQSAEAQGLILYTTISLDYSIKWEKVYELLMNAALSTEHILKEPKPFVLQTALDDFYIKYQINCYTDTPQLMQHIYSELHKNIHEKFNAAGVEIMSPHYTAFRNGNRVTLPE